MWHKNTPFGIIARGGKGFVEEKVLIDYLDFEYLVCNEADQLLIKLLELTTPIPNGLQSTG